MDIGAISMEISNSKVMQAVDITMTKKAMDLQETQAAAIIESLQSLPQPQQSFGHRLNVLI